MNGNMKPIAKRLRLFVSRDGIRVHSSSLPSSGVLIPYGAESKDIVRAPSSDDDQDHASLECHGLVGLFNVGSSRFLIAIVGREEVAQLNGKPIYVITKVALVRLDSAAEAEKTVKRFKASPSDAGSSSTASHDDGESSSNDEEVQQKARETSEDDPGVTTPANPSLEPSSNSTSVAQDVIERRGQYGMFAERWFSKNGWVPGRSRIQDVATSTLTAVGQLNPLSRKPDPSQPAQEPKKALTGHDTPEIAVSLLPKLLRTTEMMLCSRSFYFSYDLDITRRLGTHLRNDVDLPLHKVVDSLFFWNRHLCSDLISSGMQALVLPVMQGFVGQQAFAAPRKHLDAAPAPVETSSSPSEDLEGEQSTYAMQFKMTLISRRSVKRSGLRYLRRGIDEEGNVANTVETEQILASDLDKESSRELSFTQLRGSIPLYFSQSPYSFHPTPVLHHSYEVNHAAFKRHFQLLRDRYTNVQAALLVDKNGFEAPIGESYEHHVKKWNEGSGGADDFDIGFEWFDFHKECRGMKFENVSTLVNTLDSSLTDFGYTEISNGKIQKAQSGVCRSNCMDCLDRSNVVQSALGRHMLHKQLEELGAPSIDLRFGEQSKFFNTLWADNGDAISKLYASTAALKGDYTRTSKRNYQGALNDFSLTLSRYYSNIVNDFFSQTVIDYLLGNVTDRIFEDFETNLMSADPGMSISKIRQNAIDASIKIVIEDGAEELQHGWVVLTPAHSNTLRTLPLEEVVLLVTDQALYAVRFDWTTEKVESFERVALASVVGLRRGTYITSTFSTADTDARRNVGLAVRYEPWRANIQRRNTRSMSTLMGADDAPDAATATATTTPALTSNRKLRFLAFKAPPDRSAVAGDSAPRDHGPMLSETSVIESICEDIARAADHPVEVEVKDLISLQDAKKSVGLLEQATNSLKRFIWA